MTAASRTGLTRSALSTLSTADPEKCWTPEDIVALATRRDPVSPLGTYYYSLHNYVLWLGMIIERCAGTTYADQPDAIPLTISGPARQLFYPARARRSRRRPATANLFAAEHSAAPSGRCTHARSSPPIPLALGPAGAISRPSRPCNVGIALAPGISSTMRRQLDRWRLSREP